MHTAGISQIADAKVAVRRTSNAGQFDVERLEQEYESNSAEVERDALDAYYDAVAAAETAGSDRGEDALAGTISEAARIRYETGVVPKSDMIRRKAAAERRPPSKSGTAGTPRGRQSRSSRHFWTPMTQAVPVFAVACATSTPRPRRRLYRGPLRRLQRWRRTYAPQTKRLRSQNSRPGRTGTSMRHTASGPMRKTRSASSDGSSCRFPETATIEPRIREAIARREAAARQIEVLRQQLRLASVSAAARRNEAREQIDSASERVRPAGETRIRVRACVVPIRKDTSNRHSCRCRAISALNVDYYDFLRQEQQAEADIVALRNGARSGAMVAFAAKGGMR